MPSQVESYSPTSHFFNYLLMNERPWALFSCRDGLQYALNESRQHSPWLVREGTESEPLLHRAS